MLNYESELSEVFLTALSHQYNVDKNVVFDYFYFRCLIANGIQKIDRRTKEQYLKSFLIKELNLPANEKGFTYKNEFIHISFSLENSLENIVTDWRESSSWKKVTNSKGITLPYEDFIKMEWTRILRHSKNKAKPYKDSVHYQSYLKWHGLMFLNKLYMANPTAPKKIEHVKYPDDYDIFTRTLEEIYGANIHSVEFISTKSVDITEKDLEDFLIKNLDLIEEGMKLVDRQHYIKDGRIDIVAKDKENCFVLIELKVQEDKELIWQTIFYPMQFKKEHNLDAVRMITVAPNYTNHILKPLKKVDGVEIFQFKPSIELGKIKSLDISKVS